MLGTLAVTGAIALVAGGAVHRIWKRARREQYIRSFMFPRGVFEKLAAHRPGLGAKEQQLVARALRQFFLAYLKSGCRRVAMPSQVADDLWHEFILFTRNYQKFCDEAFGRFLHHTPAVTLGKGRADNEGLRRVWWFTCLEENINPRKPTRLPLLFALDRKLGIENGFVYQLDCGRAPADVRDGNAGVQCAEAFHHPDYSGGSDAAGDSSWDMPGSSDVGDSGGCSGGCGGGD
jgi:hypothetical protein